MPKVRLGQNDTPTYTGAAIVTSVRTGVITLAVHER